MVARFHQGGGSRPGSAIIYSLPITDHQKHLKPTEEGWREIARQASEERDPDKLLELTQQLLEKYDEAKR